ncbi:MAG: ribosome maturation factor RimM [Gammaproteobacteria bacterium]|nr:ribosome maturation factor RimM [Gammaproteobacteria bacterium]
MPESEQRQVTLGRVAGVFGVKGWVRIQSFTRPADNIFEYAPWNIGGTVWTIDEAQEHGPGFIVSLAGIADRDAAAAMIGAEIQVPRSALPEPEPGAVYWADLIGLEVVCEDGQPLGSVESLLENGVQDVLVIRGDERQHLVPLVRGPIVKSIDIGQGRIIVDWSPEY